MPAKTYRLSPLAEADLEEIWHYTFHRWSLEQADSYLRSLVTTFELIVEGRKQGRAVDVRPGYLKYLVGAHVIYFKAIEERIEIIRVLHSGMDVDRHL